jgi:hypothetical protein
MITPENFMKFGFIVSSRNKEYLYGTKSCDCELTFVDPIDIVPFPNIVLSLGKRDLVLSFVEAQNLAGILQFMIDLVNKKKELEK